jgi:hypothetical protein
MSQEPKTSGEASRLNNTFLQNGQTAKALPTSEEKTTLEKLDSKITTYHVQTKHQGKQYTELTYKPSIFHPPTENNSPMGAGGGV